MKITPAGAGLLSAPYVGALKRTISELFQTESRANAPASAQSSQPANPVIRINSIAPAPSVVSATDANASSPATVPSPVATTPEPAPPQVDKTVAPLPDAPNEKPAAADPSAQPEPPTKPVPPQP